MFTTKIRPKSNTEWYFFSDFYPLWYGVRERRKGVLYATISFKMYERKKGQLKLVFRQL